MIKHRYDFRAKGHKWSVYFTDPNKDEPVGNERFYDDCYGGFYCTYFGPVEVEEIYKDGKLVGHKEVVNGNSEHKTNPTPFPLR